MLLYIVRHGRPDYTTDTLTELGWKQAEAVGKRMAASGIEHVFTSPMGRARQTAEPTCRLLGLTPKVEEWAHEIGDERLTPYPDGIPKSISVLPNTVFRTPDNLNRTYDQAFQCTGIQESKMQSAIEYITKEGNDFLERLGYKEENGVYKILKPNEERVALFCHAAFSRAWLSVLLHIPLNIMWAGTDVTYTGVTVIEFKNYENGYTAPKCLCFSDMSHLYAEGLGLEYDDDIRL